MRGLGILLVLVGLAMAVVALFLDTTAGVSMPIDLRGLGVGSYNSGDVYNLGKLQQQMLIFVGGCAIALAGVVLTAAAAVADRVTGAPEAHAVSILVPEPAPEPEPIDPEILAEQEAEAKRNDMILIGIMVVGAILVFGAFALVQD